jgi:hypothetical protein
MACILSGGYSVGCKTISGIQEVYIGTYNGGATASGGLGYVTDANGQITSFVGTTSSFYRFQQPIETGSVTVNGNFNEQNGTAYWDQVAEITISGVTQSTINQVDALGKGRWRILILDQNGNYTLMGKVNPVTVTAGTGGLGKAYADLNGFVITFTGKEFDVLTQVSSSAAAQLITN